MPIRPTATWLALPGLLALLIEPALWLARTWSDPSYDSEGAWVAALVAGLLGAAVASGTAPPDPRVRRAAFALLAATAALRLTGRVLSVQTIGALALVVDVFAVALLLRTQARPFAVHPGALAGLSLLALPVEHLLQRLLGHPLQWLGAVSAQALLTPIFPQLTREGVLLLHPDAVLAIDLPCSGARGLVMLSGLALLCLCRRRAGFAGTVAAAVATCVGAWIANTARVVALFSASHAGWAVAEEPLHSLLGTFALALGALPLLWLARRFPARSQRTRALLARPSALRRRSTRSGLRWPAALAVSLAGIGIALAPARPIDVSAPLRTTALAPVLDDWRGEVLAPSAQEQHYFARFGGGVDKRAYDDGSGFIHTALLVRTRAPLRHLHGPDRCLLGAGHRVTRMGVTPASAPGMVPTVLYRSIAPDGEIWRVEASFVSDRGESAHSVSEVVWRWLAAPEAAWSLVERITPWPLCELDPARCRNFDRALFAALDTAPAPASAPTKPLHVSLTMERNGSP